MAVRSARLSGRQKATALRFLRQRDLGFATEIGALLAATGAVVQVRRALRQQLRWVAMRVRGSANVAALQKAGLRLGEAVYIGIGTYIDPDFCFLVSIGDRTVLSVDVTILAHDASTRRPVGWTRLAPVRLGADVFVGARALILPGVTVGDGAIVAAGSVVRHDVQPGVIVAGNPARPIGDAQPYLQLHAGRAAERPRWPREGWTAGTGSTADRIVEMRTALSDHGEGYIE